MFATNENRENVYSSEFLTELRGIVLNNLTRDNFGVKDLAREVSLSRSQLHRRLKAYTGLSTSCFIRQTRLLKASELLLSDHKTISEIAYQVGFGSPSYFNKCFHDYFGNSPGEYKRLLLNGETEQVPQMIKNGKSYCRSRNKILRYTVILIIVLIILFVLFYLFSQV